jgi:hypothetical protein
VRTRWTVVSIGLLALSASLAGQNPVFRAGTDSVLVDVFVRANGPPVEGLSADAFEVRDNRVVQTITSVTYEREPISVTLVLETGTNAAMIARLEAAVTQVIGALRPDDRAALVTFGRRITQVTGSLTAPVKLERPKDAGPPVPPGPLDLSGRAGGRAASAGPRAGDAIADALTVSLATGPSAGRRQLVILFTGGGTDSASFLDWSAVNELGWRTDAIVDYVVAQPLPVSAYQLNQPPFDPILVATGGRFIPAGPADNIGAAFRSAIDEVRSSYILSYTPRAVKREGWHDISVKLKKGKADVRARQGYFGG